jgi:transposase InsO family protein
MDITGPYPTTPRGNRYLLKFTDNFTWFVEAFLISDQTLNTCAKIYASQIATRHGTGSTLVTDQVKAFMSTFFQATCKMLGINRIRTSALEPALNGLSELFHRSLHAGFSHYINSTTTNWDVAVPYYLMAYRATPNTTTGFSPFYLLHGREMDLPTSDDLKDKLAQKVQIKNKA